MSDTSQYFPQDMGYGQSDLLSFLMSMYGGADSTDAGRVLKMMTDPKFAAMAGFFDPMQLPQYTPQEFVPTYGKIVASYVNDPDPTMKTVATGLLQGSMSPYAAQQALLKSGTFTGTSEDAKSLVDSIVSDVQAANDEQASFNADEAKRRADYESNDPMRALGLPSPMEKYTAGVDPLTGEFTVNAPLDKKTEQILSKATGDYAAAQKALADYKAKHKGYITPEEMAALRASQGAGAPAGAPKPPATPAKDAPVAAGPDDRSRLRRFYDENIADPLAPAVQGAADVTDWLGNQALGVIRAPGYWLDKGWNWLMENPDDPKSGGSGKPMEMPEGVDMSKFAGAHGGFRGGAGYRTDKPVKDMTAAEKLWHQKVGTPYEQLKRAERAKRNAEVLAQSATDFMNANGRTPYNDALRQRMMFFLSGGLGQ